MKKILCILITVTLLFTSVETAYAKKQNADKKYDHKKNYQEYKDKDDKKIAEQKQKEAEERKRAEEKKREEERKRAEEKKREEERKRAEEEKKECKEYKQEFKINDSPIIKYGYYKLPLAPIVKGMGATVTFDKTTAILKIVRGNITILINFKQETVTINGVEDTNTGIFAARKNKRTVVLVKYVAHIFGIRVEIDDDEIEVEVPGLTRPNDIIITPIGTVVLPNTLNNTTLYMNASAKITAGQATGGKAELYVGSKLVAVDAYIAATDNEVTFTTSDGTPTNAELRSSVPTGGAVTVKLYNSNNNAVTSQGTNPTLIVDYVSPTVASITTAEYDATLGQIKLNVTGAEAAGDKVDVTKLTVHDVTNNRSYRLTDATGTGSSGIVKNSNLLVITLGSTDKLALAGYVGPSLYLSIASGSLLKDAAGNVSVEVPFLQSVPVTASLGLSAPTNVAVTPVGGTVVANTLNSTNLYMNASARITAGQVTGGRAELYVGNRLVATDYNIASTDTEVTFTTSDSTPTNAELQTAVPSGGVVSVKLYNVYNNVVASSVSNPTLTVDYIIPTITTVSSAIYNVAGNQLYLVVTGAGETGDKVDVTKLSLYDFNMGRTYQLTNASATGSTGAVVSSSSLVINLGSLDRQGLSGFGYSTVYLYVSTGSLLTDNAGNTSAQFYSTQTVPVTVIK